MVKPDVGEHEKVETSSGRVLIDEVNLVGGCGMANVGQSGIGTSAIFGGGEIVITSSSPR